MEKAVISGTGYQHYLASIAADGLRSFTLGTTEGPVGGEIRGVAIHGTRAIAQMRENHALGIVETLILGQAYLGAALLASNLKASQRIVLSVQCEGAAEGYTVEARLDLADTGEPATGTSTPTVSVRGWIFNPAIPLDSPPSSFDTAPFVGKGSLTITRYAPDGLAQFSGTVELHSGRLSQDLAVYFLDSEQTHTAFRFGIAFDKEGRVSGAGGMFLQAMPGAREGTLSRAEEQLAILPSPGTWFASGKSLDELVAGPFMLFEPDLGSGFEFRFDCHCSRDLIRSFIASSTISFLEELVKEGPWPVSTVCHNCGTTYSFPKEELAKMLNQAVSDASRKGQGEPVV